MLSKSREPLLFIQLHSTQPFFHAMGPDPPSLSMQMAKVRIALSKIVERSSVNTTVRLPHLLFASTHHKEDAHDRMSDIQNHQPSALFVPLSSISSKRQPELMQPLAEQDYSLCYLKGSEASWDSCGCTELHEITHRATVAWKQRSYLAENHASQMQIVKIFQDRICTKTLGIDGASDQNNMQEVYFVFWITCLFFYFLIETSEEIVFLLEITLRYSSKEFLVTIMFYVSELDIKQQLDRASHKLGKFLPGVLHRYQIPAQSLNWWKSVKIIWTDSFLCVPECLPWSLELSGTLLALGNRGILQDGCRAASPGRAPAAPFKPCTACAALTEAPQRVQVSTIRWP